MSLAYITDINGHEIQVISSRSIDGPGFVLYIDDRRRGEHYSVKDAIEDATRICHATKGDAHAPHP